MPKGSVMHSSLMRDTVLIVGAGPSGLVLAMWLTKQGVKVRIVDKTDAPGTTSRAMAVQARTLELYRQLDLTDEVLAAGHITPAINLWTAGTKRATLAFGTAGIDLTPYPYLFVYPQDQHERLLVATLKALGVEVERRTECISFEDKGDHVLSTLRLPDGLEKRFESAFIVGCDGARSIVRHGIGAAFPGGTYEKFFYVADVEASGPAANGEANIALDSSDFVAWLPYTDSGKGRLIGVASNAGETIDKDKAASMTFDDVGQDALDSIGLKVEKVNWFSTYHVHHRVTDRYKRGRAFIVGDAAHIHSPAGGQGMNTGIGDAINLAWKLAAVMKQNAPDSLLDSYEAERRAFALKLVETTDRMFSFVSSDGNFAEFMRIHIAPLFAPLVFRVEAIREYIFRMVSQAMISYRNGPIAQGAAGDVHGGDRLPWVREADNYESLSSIAWQVHVYGDTRDDLIAWCEAEGIALHRFEFTAAHEGVGLVRDAAYLMRPDSYVGCIESNADVSVLDAYLKRIIGD